MSTKGPTMAETALPWKRYYQGKHIYHSFTSLCLLFFLILLSIFSSCKFILIFSFLVSFAVFHLLFLLLFTVVHLLHRVLFLFTVLFFSFTLSLLSPQKMTTQQIRRSYNVRSVSCRMRVSHFSIVIKWKIYEWWNRTTTTSFHHLLTINTSTTSETQSFQHFITTSPIFLYLHLPI